MTMQNCVISGKGQATLCIRIDLMLSIEADNFLASEDFCFIEANVKPRTRDVDPVHVRAMK